MISRQLDQSNMLRLRECMSLETNVELDTEHVPNGPCTLKLVPT